MVFCIKLRIFSVFIIKCPEDGTKQPKHVATLTAVMNKCCFVVG